MSARRKRPPVVELENGEFVFGPLPAKDDAVKVPNKRSRVQSDEDSDLVDDDLLVEPLSGRPLKKQSSPSKNGVISLLDDSQETRVAESPDVMVIDSPKRPQSSSRMNEIDLVDDFSAPDLVEIVTPENEILAVFPDADLKDVERLLNLYQNEVQLVVQHMIEKGYTKAERPPEVSTSSSSQQVDRDFTSSSWETSAQYQADALVELTNNFPCIRNDTLTKLFRKEKQHYYHTLKFLEEVTGMQARLDYGDHGFSATFYYDAATMQRIRTAIAAYKPPTTGDANSAPMPVINVRGSSKTLPRPRDTVDPTLAAEIRWIRKKKQAELEQKDKAVAEELNYQMAMDDNALMECGCCYSEYPFEQLVQCTEAHLFCKQCLQRYAEQTLFGDGRTTLKCMNTMGDPCPGVFTESMLRASLPEKVLEKFSEAQTRDILKAAQIDDLVTCFHCQYQASMASDAGKIMHCPQCRKDTCRDCGEEGHIPLKCSEVEKKGDTAKRLQVEEALSDTRIRKCPKCKTPFFKVDGCNKMTCPCGINICYTCRKDITKEGYKHFCQVPHCKHTNCNNCRLFTNTLEDDINDMREAANKALKDAAAAAAAKNEEAPAVSDRLREPSYCVCLLVKLMLLNVTRSM